jgi:hypothetical protein
MNWRLVYLRGHSAAHFTASAVQEVAIHGVKQPFR